MELLEGLGLDQLVAIDGPQPPGRAAHVLRQVLEALAEAHGIGLVHRDVKPANVILCERGGVSDVAKVVDFGLVKDLEGETGVTHDGAIVGTPLYLAPEASCPDRPISSGVPRDLARTCVRPCRGRPQLSIHQPIGSDGMNQCRNG